MSKKFFFTLSLLTSALLVGSPTLAAPASPAAPKTPATQSQPASSQPASSKALLTKEDLPGFQEVPPELKAQALSQLAVILQQQLPGANVNPDNLFGFFNPTTSEVLVGYTDNLSNVQSQTKFDTALKQFQQPDMQKKMLSILQERVKNVKDYKVEITDYKTLANLGNIGDSSAGITLSLKVQDQPVNTNVVTFRHKDVAAMTMVVNLDGQQPQLNLGDVARKIDSRLSLTSSVTTPYQFAQLR